MLKLEEFDLMVSDFLSPLKDSSKDEYYETEWERAQDVLSLLRKHLFQADFEREARYETYLKLKAEFGSEGYTR